MKTMRPLTAVLGLAVAAFGADAATLTLSDGSRIQGELEKIVDGKVYFQTAFAGLLEIPQALVTGIESSAPVALRTRSGEVFQGPVSTDAAGTVAVSSAAGRVTTGLEAVVSGWKSGAQDPLAAAREAELEGRLRTWSYTAGAAVSGSDGNTDKLGLSLQFEAKLEGPQDRLLMYTSYRYAKDNDIRSEDEQKLGMRYTNFFADRLGWYVREELERDTFEGIDFRSTTAGGLTYRFINQPRLSLEGSAGISYRYESYADPQLDDDGSAGLDFGLVFGWQFADWGRLATTISYVPSIDQFSDYLLTHESGIDIPLGASDFWVMRFGINNQYNSKPGPGREKMDTTYFARLILSWQ